MKLAAVVSVVLCLGTGITQAQTEAQHTTTTETIDIAPIGTSDERNPRDFEIATDTMVVQPDTTAVKLLDPWVVRFGVSLIVEVPYGPWYEGLGPGTGYELSAEVKVVTGTKRDRIFSLRATYSRTGLETNEEDFVPASVPGLILGPPRVNFTIRKMMAWLVVTRRLASYLSLFSDVGVGATLHEIEMVVPVTDTATGQTGDLVVAVDETELTLGAGIGVVLWPVETNVGVELGVDLLWVIGTLEEVEGTTDGYLLTGKIGVTVAF